MKAIGNYIHLTAERYIKHGTSKSGAFQNWVSQKGKIRARSNKNKSSLSPQERKDLEQTISAMMNINPGTGKLAAAQYGVEEILTSRFTDAANRLNWNTGGMEWKDGEKENVLGKLHRHRNAQNQLELDLQNAKNKTEKLLEIMKKTIASGTISKSELHEDKRRVVQLLRELEKRMGLDVRSRGWKWEDPKDRSDYYLMQNINNMIEKYAAYPAINVQQGYAFEAMIAMAPYVAQGMAYEEAAKQIVGSNLEVTQLDKKAFAGFLQGEIGKDTIFQASGSSSAGKVDVKLQWNRKIAKISAKNVNLSGNYGWTNIVSDTSLLFLMQDLNSNFVNHYLNLFALHEDESQFHLGGMRKAILSEVKLILFYKALTGDNFKRTSADTFIINDNSKKGGVRVYCMDDIVQSVINSGTTQNISIKSGGVPIDNLRFANDIVKDNVSGSVRIARLLANVHSYKLQVKFNASKVLKSL